MQRPVVRHRIRTRRTRPASVAKRERRIAPRVAAARLKAHARSADARDQVDLRRQRLLMQQDRFVGRAIAAWMGRRERNPAIFPVEARRATRAVRARTQDDIDAPGRGRTSCTCECGVQARDAVAGTTRVHGRRGAPRRERGDDRDNGQHCDEFNQGYAGFLP